MGKEHQFCERHDSLETKLDNLLRATNIIQTKQNEQEKLLKHFIDKVWLLIERMFRIIVIMLAVFACTSFGIKFGPDIVKLFLGV